MATPSAPPASPDPSVADAVKRHAAGQAQVGQPGLLACETRHLDHRFFGDVLDRARQIHLTLGQLGFGLPRRAVEQSLERRAGHRQAVWVREVLHVHPHAAVIAELDEMVLDRLDVLRLAIRRQPHHLVLTGIDSESREVGERRVQKAERVREPLLDEQLDVAAAPDADRRRRPFADAVDGDDRRFLERRGIERGRGVRLVVFAEEDLAVVAGNLLAQVLGHPQLFADPQRHRHHVRTEAARRAGDIRGQQPLELDERLLVEGDVIQLCGGDARFAQAVLDSPCRKRRIVLLAGEPFFLRGGDDPSVLDEDRRRIMVVRRNPENADGQGVNRTLMARIECWAARAAC